MLVDKSPLLYFDEPFFLKYYILFSIKKIIIVLGRIYLKLEFIIKISNLKLL